MASRMSYLDTKILMPELPTTPIFGVGSKRFEEPPDKGLRCSADIASPGLPPRCLPARLAHRLPIAPAGLGPIAAIANAILGQGKMPVLRTH
jgi:hypothetical protein